MLTLLPTELPRVHEYCDGALALPSTLKERLRRLTPQQFEQVKSLDSARPTATAIHVQFCYSNSHRR